MHDIGLPFEESLEGLIKSKHPDVPFYSTVNGRPCAKNDCFDPSYWRENLESVVLFNTAVQSIIEETSNPKTFLEIGPHCALEGPLRQIFGSHEPRNTYVPTVIRGQDGVESMLTTAGKLHLRNIPIAFSAINPKGTVLTDLPIYPWHHEEVHWSESRLSKEWRLRKFPRHELLGSRVLEANDLQPMWRNVIHLDEVPWISDHRIWEDIVFPAAGFLAMVIEALRQVTGIERNFSMKQVAICKALVMTDVEGIEITTSLRPKRLTTSEDSPWFEFSIAAFTGDRWEKHCSGEAVGESRLEGAMPQSHFNFRKVSSTKWYQTLGEAGLNYSGMFRGMSDIEAGTSKQAANAIIDMPTDTYPVHPVTLDLSLQLFSVAMANGISGRFDKVLMPTWIERLEISAGSPPFCAQAVTTFMSRKKISGYVIARTKDNIPRLLMSGVQMSPLDVDQEITQSDRTPIAQQEWGPSVDFVKANDLITPTSKKRSSRLLCEKLATLCMIEHRDRLKTLQTPLPYMLKYRA